jgi:hypothetical protein
VNDPELGIVEIVMKETGCDRPAATSFIAVTGILCLAYLSGDLKAPPAWTKDLPPSFERRAGPWRGKGSFGTHFGSQAKHR